MLTCNILMRPLSAGARSNLNPKNRHCGVLAQDVLAIFESEGLDGTKYGLFCRDVTTEQGKEIDRLGIRYGELLAFIISTL